jgi:hypothetical protein
MGDRASKVNEHVIVGERAARYDETTAGVSCMVVEKLAYPRQNRKRTPSSWILFHER